MQSPVPKAAITNRRARCTRKKYLTFHITNSNMLLGGKMYGTHYFESTLVKGNDYL